MRRLYENTVLFLDTWDFGVSDDQDKPKSECPVKGITGFDGASHCFLLL